MKLWTVKEAARRLGITEAGVITLVRIGFLVALVRHGKLMIVANC